MQTNPLGVSDPFLSVMITRVRMTKNGISELSMTIAYGFFGLRLRDWPGFILGLCDEPFFLRAMTIS